MATPQTMPSIYLSVSVFNIFFFAFATYIYPLYIEAAVEVTYPVPEGIVLTNL